MTGNELVRVRAVDAGRWPYGSGHVEGVFLEADDGRTVMMVLGPAEAAAIALILSGTATRRPLTHPFYAALLTAAGVHVREVVIDALVDGVFHAKVRLEPGGAGVDARPSDAIALALLTGAPVFVAPNVVDDVADMAAEARGSLLVHARDLAAEALSRFSATVRGPVTKQGPLTRREQQVLQLVAEGRTNAEIGAALGVSRFTVTRHLANVYGKLGAAGRAQAVTHLYSTPVPGV